MLLMTNLLRRDEPNDIAATIEAMLDTISGASERARGPRAIRLPLYETKAEASIMIWLALMRSAGRKRDHAMSAFWRIDGAGRWIQVFLGAPPVDMFWTLWRDPPPEADVVDLRAPVTVAPARDDIVACFERTDGTLDDLLTAVVREVA
jgi:hypothetical protein